jgi:hypothetical protein
MLRHTLAVAVQVMQLPASFHRYNKHTQQFPAGTHRVAWAFLRFNQPATPSAAHPLVPQGDGLPAVPAPSSAPVPPPTPRGPTLGDLKLQLYRYRADNPLLGLRKGPDQDAAAPAGAPLLAYGAWKDLMATPPDAGRGAPALVEKYPAALHVTVQAMPRCVGGRV